MNAADPKQVQDAKNWAKNRRDQELNDLRAIVATNEGRRFFKRMFALGHMEDDPFTGNSVTYFNLGLRKFALKYWNDVKEADVAAFVKIITEGEDHG